MLLQNPDLIRVSECITKLIFISIATLVAVIAFAEQEVAPPRLRITVPVPLRAKESQAAPSQLSKNDPNLRAVKPHECSGVPGRSFSDISGLAKPMLIARNSTPEEYENEKTRYYDPRIGRCLIADCLPKIAERILIPRLEHDLREKPISPNWKKGDGKTDASIRDWVGIDITTRTLSGEIGGCSNLETMALAVARIIQNRTEASEKTPPNRLSPYSGFSRGTPERHEVLGPLLREQQFDVWSTSSSRATGITSCPDRVDPGFRKMLSISAQMILDPNKFKQRTAGFENVLHYSDGVTTADARLCSGYTKLTNLSLGGKPVGSSCIDFWSAPSKTFHKSKLEIRQCVINRQTERNKKHRLANGEIKKLNMKSILMAIGQTEEDLIATASSEKGSSEKNELPPVLPTRVPED